MTWKKEVQKVLTRYYTDPNAIVVCISVFNRFKALEMVSINDQDAVRELFTMLVDDYLILPSNPFWSSYGGIISVETGNRFFDWLKAQRLLQANYEDPEKIRQNVQTLQLSKSFLSIADLILRLHVPFSEYTRESPRLYEDLLTIEGL